MKKLVTSVILLSTLSSCATTEKTAGLPATPESFKQVHAEYKQALAAQDYAKAFDAAKQSYQIGCKITGDASEDCLILAHNTIELSQSVGDAENIYRAQVKHLENYYGEQSFEVYKFVLQLLASDRAFARDAHSYRHELYQLVEELPQELLTQYPTQLTELINIVTQKIDAKSKRVSDYWHYYVKSEQERRYQLMLVEKASISLLAIEASKFQQQRLFVFKQLIKLYSQFDLTDKLSQQINSYVSYFPNSQDAKPIAQIEPVYPSLAFKQLEEGWVEATFSINQIGKTDNIKVVASSSRAFERNTVKAIAGWQYLPAIENGKLLARHNKKIRMQYELTSTGRARIKYFDIYTIAE